MPHCLLVEKIVMDLPHLFASSEALGSRLLLCSILTDTTIQSLLLKVTSSGTKVLQRSLVYTYSEQKTAVVRLDESLQELGEESEKINEIVFALEHNWMKKGSLVGDKKNLLHALVTDLALKPVGFVLQSEAIVQHSLNHNPHFSAIVLLLNQTKVMVTVVSQGKVISVETVGKSADIGSDLKEAFARFVKNKDEAHLPGKLLCASFVLTEAEIVDIQQKLLDMDWQGIPFVQTPTIDVVKPELAASIIAEQAGQATHTDLAKASNLASVAEATSEELGFAPVAHKPTETAVEGVDHTTLPTSFGIPIAPKSLPDEKDEEEAAPAEASEEVTEETKTGKFSLGSLFGSFSKKAPAEKHAAKQGEKHGDAHKKYHPMPFILTGLVAGLLVLVGVFFVGSSFLTTVTVAVTPVTKTVTKEVNLTLDPTITSSDVDSLHIPAKKVTVDITKEESSTTTGIKIVGEKAKGEVVIFNKTSSQKTFPAGTVVSKDKLQFVTDAEVTVPAAVDSPTTHSSVWGEEKVAATAYVIGIEGNIGKNTELTVASFDTSTYLANSTVDFTGGSSREVRVVAKEDRDGLITRAKKDAIAEAQDKFKEQSGNGTYVIPTQDISVTKSTFSADVEAPAETVTSTVTATVTGLSYQVSDLAPIAQALLSDQVPEGYSLADSTPQILSAPPDEIPKNSAALTIKANVSSTAKPQLNLNSLPAEIAGQSVDKAREQLLGKKTISTVTFTFKPAIFGKLMPSLPKDKKKIVFEEVGQ